MLVAAWHESFFLLTYLLFQYASSVFWVVFLLIFHRLAATNKLINVCVCVCVCVCVPYVRTHIYKTS